MHGSGVVRILYLTYDGLSSLIGQSQIWPYLKGLAGARHQFDVISFEHRERLERQAQDVVSRPGRLSSVDLASVHVKDIGYTDPAASRYSACAP